MDNVLFLAYQEPTIIKQQVHVILAVHLVLHAFMHLILVLVAQQIILIAFNLALLSIFIIKLIIYATNVQIFVKPVFTLFNIFLTINILDS
jgi:hypothetical protein